MARSIQNPLQESPSASYLQRTEWNVRDGDATVLFSLASELTGGSKKTVEFAKKHHKPWIHLAAGDQDVALVGGSKIGWRKTLGHMQTQPCYASP